MVYITLHHQIIPIHFEVDSTESVWYTHPVEQRRRILILKLTPQSQYGIIKREFVIGNCYFEVDSTESVWYTPDRAGTNNRAILKLTPQSQYGITPPNASSKRPPF